MRSQISNPLLLNAIRIVKSDSSKETLFFEALLQAKFLCPVQTDTGNLAKNTDGSIALSEDTPVSFVSIADSSGAQYLMAFTDRNELAKWSQGKYHQTMVYAYNDYKGLLMPGDMPYQGVVINPFSDNVVLGKEVFSDGNLQKVTARGQESLMIGLPKDYPTSMVEKLKQYFHKTRLVEIAFLLWMARGEEAGYLLVLGTKTSPQQLFPQIGEICKPYLNNKLLDMVLLNSAFGQSAVEDQLPFYIV